MPLVGKMERLEPSRLLLEAPEGVEGDFDVAREAPAVDWGILPCQVYEGGLCCDWSGPILASAWGDAVCGSDGKYYVSIGDHGSPHGTCYVYSVDPTTRETRLVVDVNEVVGMPDDGYAPGKLHSPIIDTGDGWLYFGTFQSTFDDTGPEHGYQGDWLLRYHMASGKCQSLGVAVPDSSIVSLRCHARSMRLNGHAYKGKTMEEPRNRFFSYDLKRRELAYLGGPESELARAIIQAHDGRVYYDSAGLIVRYDPEANRVVETDARIPGNGQVRAASLPDADGVAYCITMDGVVFSFDTKTGTLTPMGNVFPVGNLYTAVCVLDPTGRYLYYAPGSGGMSSQSGSPVVQLDVKTGRRKVLAFLSEYMRREKSYNMGGTYSIALNADASQLVMCWNGCPTELGVKDFGLCSAMILHIPQSERPLSTDSRTGAVP